MSRYHATSVIVAQILWAVAVLGMVATSGPLWADGLLFLVSCVAIWMGWRSMAALKAACKAEDAARAGQVTRYTAQAGHVTSDSFWA